MGMFAAGGKLYFVTKADGNLNSIALTTSGPTGVPTVVDGPLVPNSGGNDWRSRALFIVPGNQTPQNTPPVASFPAPTCTDLVCTFDGTGSHDAEGPISSYAWNFGDTANNTASGATTQHTFTKAGTFQVALTVTDSGGLTNTQTRSVTVSVTQGNPITYVGSATGTANSKTPTVKVPSGVVAGDTLVLTAGMSNATSATAPAGWTQVGDLGTPATVSLRGKVWVKTATAADANSTVTVTQDAVHKAALAITVYRGAKAASVTATASADTNTTNHGAPTVAVPAGSWVLSFFTEKSATSNTWTAPSGTSSRAEIHSAASSAVSTLVVDSNGPRTGTVTGSVATTGTAASRGVNFTVVLSPN